MVHQIQTELSPGTIVGGAYKIERPLGVGGMGTVYEALQLRLGRKVALKLLHARFSSDASVVKRFQREAELAASLGHDNICEVTDLGMAQDGSPYLVMPLLKGQPLCDLLQGERPLEAPRLVDICGQILSALSVAHQANIVHRDLKPGNVFITQLGDRTDFVKLLDFGICKVKSQDTANELTRSGTVLGTPYYMAPEQARGARDIDHRADIYALGVILYEALTGRRPFDGESYNEIMFRILTESFPLPRAVEPGIPSDLERVILRSMSRDPAERYQSADEMRAALESARLTTEQARDLSRTGINTEPAIPMPFTPDSLPLSQGEMTGAQSGAHLTPQGQAVPAVGRSALAKGLWAGGLAAVAILGIWVAWMLQATPEPEPSPVVPTSVPQVMKPAVNVAVPEAPPVQSEIPEAKPTPVAIPESPEQAEDPVVSPSKAPESEQQAAVTAGGTEKKKRRKNQRPKAEKPGAVSPTSAKPGLLKGRFGATVVSDYGD